METNPEVLRRLDDLELQRYAGEIKTFPDREESLYQELMMSPVKVKVTAPIEVCAARFYQFCLNVQGEYDDFKQVRLKVSQESMQEFDRMALSVLFEGIYEGDPEDVMCVR